MPPPAVGAKAAAIMLLALIAGAAAVSRANPSSAAGEHAGPGAALARPHRASKRVSGYVAKVVCTVFPQSKTCRRKRSRAQLAARRSDTTERQCINPGNWEYKPVKFGADKCCKVDEGDLWSWTDQGDFLYTTRSLFANAAAAAYEQMKPADNDLGLMKEILLGALKMTDDKKNGVAALKDMGEQLAAANAGYFLQLLGEAGNEGGLNEALTKVNEGLTLEDFKKDLQFIQDPKNKPTPPTTKPNFLLFMKEFNMVNFKGKIFAGTISPGLFVKRGLIMYGLDKLSENGVGALKGVLEQQSGKSWKTGMGIAKHYTKVNLPMHLGFLYGAATEGGNIWNDAADGVKDVAEAAGEGTGVTDAVLGAAGQLKELGEATADTFAEMAASALGPGALGPPDTLAELAELAPDMTAMAEALEWTATYAGGLVASQIAVDIMGGFSVAMQLTGVYRALLSYVKESHDQRKEAFENLKECPRELAQPAHHMEAMLKAATILAVQSLTDVEMPAPPPNSYKYGLGEAEEKDLTRLGAFTRWAFATEHEAKGGGETRRNVQCTWDLHGYMQDHHLVRWASPYDADGKQKHPLTTNGTNESAENLKKYIAGRMMQVRAKDLPHVTKKGNEVNYAQMGFTWWGHFLRELEEIDRTYVQCVWHRAKDDCAPLGSINPNLQDACGKRDEPGSCLDAAMTLARADFQGGGDGNWGWMGKTRLCKLMHDGFLSTPTKDAPREFVAFVGASLNKFISGGGGTASDQRAPNHVAMSALVGELSETSRGNLQKLFRKGWSGMTPQQGGDSQGEVWDPTVWERLRARMFRLVGEGASTNNQTAEEQKRLLAVVFKGVGGLEDDVVEAKEAFSHVYARRSEERLRAEYKDRFWKAIGVK